MPQPSIDHASVRDNLGQASQDPSKVPHWVQAAQACPPLFADLSLLSQLRGRSADCELWARARKGTERDLEPSDGDLSWTTLEALVRAWLWRIGSFGAAIT